MMMTVSLIPCVCVMTISFNECEIMTFVPCV